MFILKSYGNSHDMKTFPDFPIGFGAASISGEGGGYGFGAISEAESSDLVKAAYEAGIRLFDTAPIYGFGTSEQRLGKSLKSLRDNCFIVSKGGVTWDQNKRVDKNNQPQVIQRMLEQSLRDLQTEYIDLYMIHWPDERHDVRHAMEVLVRAKEAGKINFIGLCNTNESEFEKASEVCKIDALQDSWNLFSWHETYERIGGFGKSGKIYRMGYGTFDKGILSGRVREGRKFDQHDARSWAPWWKSQDRAKKISIVNELEIVLNDHGFRLPQFALWFALQWRDFLDVALVGVRSRQQLTSLMEALDEPVSIGTIKEIINDLKAKGYNEAEAYDLK